MSRGLGDVYKRQGPEGGRDGGRIIASGTPEDIAQTNTHTAQFLKKELNI